jgi:hypothetical protein
MSASPYSNSNMTTQPTLFATNDRTWREPVDPHNRDRCDETVRFQFGPWALRPKGIAYRLTIGLGRSGDRWTWGVAIYTPEGGQHTGSSIPSRTRGDRQSRSAMAASDLTRDHTSVDAPRGTGLTTTTTITNIHPQTP